MKVRAVLVLLVMLAAEGRAADVIAVRVHESRTLQVFGATAAFAVDAAVADASALNGIVTIFGRGAGRTKVVVVSVTGQAEYEVRVDAPPALVAATSSSGINGRVETRIETAVPQLHTTVDIDRQSGAKRTELHVDAVQYRASQGQRGETTLPSAWYRIFTPGRELTFLDRLVDHSPLTVDSAALRGVHYLDDRWRLHAGYTAYAAYQSFLLPAERSFVAGAAYAVPLSRSSRVTPGLFVFENGTAASLLYDFTRPGLAARAELGVSRTVAGAVQLTIDRENERARLDVRYRPNDFPGLEFGLPRGFNADAAWSRTFARGSSADASFTANDFDFAGFRQRSIAATSNGRLRLTERASLLGGASYGRFDDTSTFTIPAGVQYDAGRFGMSALARWSQSSATNRGGGGFRVTARASAGRVFATAYADHQRQAPTLSLIFREQPDLALALEQLGIIATTPGDIARALRENSALIALGYIEGVTIELAPARTQGGLELSWLGLGPARPQLRARLLFNRNEGVSSRTDTIIASLAASRRVTASTDVYARYSYWLTKRQGEEATTQPGLEVGIRHQFDELPSFLPDGRGTITGVVYLDENIDGTPEGGLAGAEVSLDGARTVRTESDGSFAFKKVTRGAHRVSARVPDAPDAYFTTPSRVEAQSGENVRFGVARTPARLFGRVVSDAGDGIATVAVTLARGPTQLRATTASDGSFSLAAAPGEWVLEVDSSSLPAGYSTTARAARSVVLDRAQPQRATLELRANRSVTGVAAGVSTLTVEPLGRTIPVDAQGRFSIRSLPAGDVTLRAEGIEHRLTLPKEPVLISDIALSADALALPPVIAAAVHGSFVVQLGTFRIRENAIELVARARRAGVEPVILSGEQYLVVRTAPFRTRDAAASVARRLTDAGMEAVVMPSSR